MVIGPGSLPFMLALLMSLDLSFGTNWRRYVITLEGHGFLEVISILFFTLMRKNGDRLEALMYVVVLAAASIMRK